MNLSLMKLSTTFLISFVLLALAGCGGGGYGGGGGGGGGGSAPSGLSYTSPVTATVGTAITSLSATVTGSVTSYSVSPALPAGLSLNTTSGLISGTPTAAAAQNPYTITATNSYGSTTFVLTLTVNPAAPSGLSYTSPVTATVGTAISPLAPTVTGTVSSYSTNPALPAGLSLNTMTGVISGTPTATAAQATYTITATNVTGSTNFGWVLTVNAAATTVSGTAAAGAPIPNATVTLKDAANHVLTAMTGVDGSFQFDVTGLTPPFLLSVSSAATTFYSFASQGGTANLNPYTTVVLQSYYTAQGTTVATAFGGALSASSFPNPQQLTLLVSPFVSILQPYLANAGVSQAQLFSPFTSTFTANSTGFDLVLDRTVLNASLLSFTVDNGSGSTAGPLSSTVTIQITPGSSTTLATVAVNILTTNTANNSTSSSQQVVPVGTTPAQQAALVSAEAGILAMFANLSQVVATKGPAIVAADILPFVDASYLEDGQNAAAYAAKLATNFATAPLGTTISASFLRVNRFDVTNEIMDTAIQLTITNGSTSVVGFLMSSDNPLVGSVYRQQSGGGWAIYGQQTQYSAHTRISARRNYDANSLTPDAAPISEDFQAQARVPVGALSAAAISGPNNSLPDCTMNPSPVTQSTGTLTKAVGVFNGQDEYDLACQPSNGAVTGVLPPGGTIYTYSLTKTVGGTVAQQTPLPGSTSDDGDLTQINGVSRSSFAGSHTVSGVAGTTLTVTFTPPTTFPLLYSFVNGFCQNASQQAGGGGNDVQGAVGNILPGVNSGTIAVPAQCSGAATTTFSVTVNFIGVNGESAGVGQRIHN